MKGRMSDAVEELMLQRDAVLFGKWVKRFPKEGEACAVVRDVNGLKAGLDTVAYMHLHAVVTDRYRHFSCVEAWNDSSQGAKDALEVVDVLDRAIRLAKEAQGEE